ncbi:pyridoxal-phosphate dependent enzyme [Sulfitobacter sp. JB4-11]|uniref:pyridoxal-phosphate dependent enzyme n=1 Tax=Sulfitobacter rhodophyticola TaxID=3238304 RepID=UPI003514D5EB
MDILHVTRPVPLAGLEDIPAPLADAAPVQALLARCPVAAATPLVDAPALAHASGVGKVWVKDERGRMGLGSFKALGAAHVIARDAAAGDVSGVTYVTASAGNHGMSVAAGAAAFGARAVVYIAETVPDTFAARLRAQGADVIREGAMYEASMEAAGQAATDNGWTLLSDSSWEGYTEPPLRVMEGYLALMAEAVDQMPHAPSHIFLQAGVGGLAAACAVMARKAWGDGPTIIVVEPSEAPALHGSVVAGCPVESSGGVSEMGRLDCKMPSLIALKGLARDADAYALITEDEAQIGTQVARDAGFASTPSGAAGFAALRAADHLQRVGLGLNSASQVLCILSEAAEDAAS